MNLKPIIKEVVDWPKKGVNFKDITTILADPNIYAEVIDTFVKELSDKQVDKIIGVDARGFLFASAVAYIMKKGLIVVRKKGKLPPLTIEEEYTLEYGTNVIEIKSDAVTHGDKVVLIDDLCASGGTAIAACNLIEKLGGIIVGVHFLIDLPFLNGSKKLKDKGYDVRSMVEYDSE